MRLEVLKEQQNTRSECQITIMKVRKETEPTSPGISLLIAALNTTLHESEAGILSNTPLYCAQGPVFQIRLFCPMGARQNLW